ncbi:MAG: hypothetical protein FJ249_00485 [Nitrospira sp.]|nr:hypothetical protein [Nitrospira sp.]
MVRAASRRLCHELAARVDERRRPGTAVRTEPRWRNVEVLYATGRIASGCALRHNPCEVCSEVCSVGLALDCSLSPSRINQEGFHESASPGSRSSKVIRGGSWSNIANYLRSAFRTNASPEGRVSRYGIRCAKTP